MLLSQKTKQKRSLSFISIQAKTLFSKLQFLLFLLCQASRHPHSTFCPHVAPCPHTGSFRVILDSIWSRLRHLGLICPKKMLPRWVFRRTWISIKNLHAMCPHTWLYWPVCGAIPESLLMVKNYFPIISQRWD